MDFHKRKAIVDVILECDKSINSDLWTYEDSSLWPVTRIFLFAFLSGNTPEKYDGLNQRIKNIVKSAKGILAPSKESKMKFPKVQYLFVGADTHRYVKNGISENKFFEPMMDFLDENNQTCMLIETHKKVNMPMYRSDRIHFAIRNLKDKDLVTRSWVSNRIESDIKQHLPTALKAKSEHLSYLIHQVINDVLHWRSYWINALTQIKPNEIFELCYYSKSTLGLNLAASSLGIPTTEVQHGGVGDLHQAYNLGIELDITSKESALPNKFWCWDEIMSGTLDNWIKTSSKRSWFIGGNPHLDSLLADLKIDSVLAAEKRKIVLYTLQTTINPILDDYVIKAIQESKDYVWYLRCHPRMTVDEKRALSESIKEHKLDYKVEVELASEYSLIELLNAADVHISKFSGSVIEASLMGLSKNVINSEIGANLFQELVKNKKAYFFDYKSNSSFLEFINNLPENRKVERTNASSNYENILLKTLTSS